MTEPDGKKFEDEKVREEGARIIGVVRERAGLGAARRENKNANKKGISRNGHWKG